jgi:DNA-binding NarL/FixJ family response regulator
MRLVGALSGEPELRVRAGVSAGQLIATGAADDLLVLHVDTVDVGAAELITGLRRDAASLPIVVVCESTDRRSARRALAAGVDGFVFAEDLDAALAATVAAVLAGQTVVPKALRASVRSPSLSVREKQILGMVVMGFSNCEIASRLFVAESTVKSHLSGAFRKLGVGSRSEAASLILDPHGSLGPGILAITPRD